MDLDKAVEAVFRAANDRLCARFQQLSLQGRIPFICECGDQNCFTVIELTNEDYERIKGQPHSFVLALGHATGAETLVEQTDRFEVVDKGA